MTLFLMGVATFVGLHHLWFWLERRKEHVHVWIVALSAGTLTYLAGYRLQMSSEVAEPAVLGARLQWTGGTVLIVVLLGLVNRFIGRAPPRALVGAAALFGGAYVACVWFTETVVRNEAMLRVTIAGERYWGVARGPVMFLFVPFMLLVAIYAIVRLARTPDVDRIERRVLLLAFGFYLLVGINEVLFALRLITTVRLFPPAFALLGVTFSALLARRVDALAGENERLLAAMRAQATILEAKNAELDTFAYSVSHDLKSPLVAIDGMAAVLREDYADRLDAAGLHALGRIEANVRRMERLIADLLRFSRVGREAYRPEAVPLRDVVDAVLEEFAGIVTQRGIVVRRPAPVLVRGIPAQVEQVVRNLVSNAVKFLGPTAAPVIEIEAVDTGDGMIACAVRDNGVGIDPAHHAKIFDIFGRLNDVETEGTGVGLALVKKIVESNGGRVWVESAKGQGATFRFTWPLGA